MKHKTSELMGALLDAAVAKAEGLEFEIAPQKVWGDGYGITIVNSTPACLVGADYFEPSTLWAQGGPLIEKFTIYVWPEVPQPAYDVPVLYWQAGRRGLGGIGWQPMCGETPLIAAMRAIAWAGHGDEVDL